MDFTHLDTTFIKAMFPHHQAEAVINGTLLTLDTEEDTDRNSDPFATTTNGREPPNPVTLAVALMLSASIGEPGRFEAMVTECHFSIVEVPGEHWIAPVTEGLHRLLRGEGHKAEISVSRSIFGAERKANLYLLSSSNSEYGLFRRNSVNKLGRDELDEADLIEVLPKRKPIIVVGTATENFQTDRVREAADLIIPVSTPDSRIIGILGRTFNSRHAPSVPETVPADIWPVDLAIAFRRPYPPLKSLAILETQQDKRQEPAKAPRPHRLALDDIHGLDPFKHWGQELDWDIKAIRTGKMEVSQLPRGLLVTGPPGIGKTQCAAAIADHCGIPIVMASAAAWLATGGGHLGSLLIAMKKSFSEAAKRAPALMVIDELDAFPCRRQDDSTFWDAAVAGLLEAMDGLSSVEGIVVVGLCNDRGGLDPALTRAGRFDHVITLTRPSVSDLARMFRACLPPHLQDADFLPFAVTIAGGTIADVDRVCRDANRLARRADRPTELSDLATVIARDERRLPEPLKRKVALHESGHALMAHLNGARLHSVTLSMTRMGGNDLGWVETSLSRDHCTLDRILELVEVLLAGHAAETIVYGASSSGSSSDLELATSILTQAIIHDGLGESLRWIGMNRSRSITISASRSNEIESLLREAHAGAKRKLAENQQILHHLQRVLLEKIHLDGPSLADEIERAFSLSAAENQIGEEG